MLQEAMEVFQIMLQEKGERIITDAYIPKDGTYRLIVMKDDGWVIKDPVDIIFNKKSNSYKQLSIVSSQERKCHIRKIIRRNYSTIL